MNIPIDRKLGLAAARSPDARLDEATVVAMGASLSAIYFDRPKGPRERMQAEQDGLPIPRPFFAAELALRAGGSRHMLFVPQDIQTVLSRPLVLRLNGKPMAEIDPTWLQLPQEELAALTAQLSVPGIHRLLRVMVTTGASLFATEAQAGLADAISRLMDLCDIPTVAPVAICQISGRLLASYPTSGPQPPTDAVALMGERLTRVKKLDCFTEGNLLHVLLPPGLPAAQLLAFSDAPLRLAAADALAPRPSVPAWLQGRSKPCHDWLLAHGDAKVAALGRELVDVRTAPKVTIRHLSAVSAGVLYALVLEDPARVVRKVILDRAGHQTELMPLYGVDGTAILTGFAELPGAALGGETCQIRVLHHSGRLRLLTKAPLAAYDGGIPASFEEAWALGADALGPVAQARAGFRRAAPPCVLQQFGAEKKIALRIVTSIGNSADLIRARAAMILAEDPAAPVEIICTMIDGPLTVGARHALAHTAAIYGIPHRLVLLPGFANGSERLRAALPLVAEGPALLLGANILPQQPGWLAFWLRRLRRQDAIAAALLATDGSIEATHEGLDPCRGLPAAHLPASGRPADRPLADCLALGPAGIARLLASDAPHPDPAHWIAATLGHSARTETRFPFHRFAPAPAGGGFAAALAETEFAMIRKDRE